MKKFLMMVVSFYLMCMSVNAQTLITDFEWQETNNTVQIAVGESHQLQYSCSDKSLPFTSSYSSSWVYYTMNPQQVIDTPTGYTVSTTGVVTGVKVGTYAMKFTGYITAKSGADKFLYITVVEGSSKGTTGTKKQRCDANGDGVVNISDVNYVISYICGDTEDIIKTSSITLNKTTATIFKGSTTTLTATVLPDNATNKTVTWTSSDETIATVADGVVTAVATGTANITATANDGSGVSATCAVTVSDDPSDQYEYVDLGLSVKWAKLNVGATSITDYGDYFAWGETNGYNSGKTHFSSETYKYYADNSETTKDDDGFDVIVYHKGYTKYVPSSDASEFGYDGTFYDDKTSLESSDDAATANWGSKWRMPTWSEWSELRSKCTWVWVTLNGVNGYKVTATNGNYIFLPAAGYFIYPYKGCLYTGYEGRYWSGELFNGVLGWKAASLYFSSSRVYTDGSLDRYGGLSVRPVRSE